MSVELEGNLISNKYDNEYKTKWFHYHFIHINQHLQECTRPRKRQLWKIHLREHSYQGAFPEELIVLHTKNLQPPDWMAETMSSRKSIGWENFFGIREDRYFWDFHKEIFPNSKSLCAECAEKQYDELISSINYLTKSGKIGQ